jgi:MFS family permease
MPALSPLYGKLSQIVGRKPILFFAITIFLFGSALCGAAQNFAWLAIGAFIFPTEDAWMRLLTDLLV